MVWRAIGTVVVVRSLSKSVMRVTRLSRRDDTQPPLFALSMLLPFLRTDHRGVDFSKEIAGKAAATAVQQAVEGPVSARPPTMLW